MCRCNAKGSWNILTRQGISLPAIVQFQSMYGLVCAIEREHLVNRTMNYSIGSSAPA